MNVLIAQQSLDVPQRPWLKRELAAPAEVQIIATSIQVLADLTGWETWANFPAERAACEVSNIGQIDIDYSPRPRLDVREPAEVPRNRLYPG